MFHLVPIHLVVHYHHRHCNRSDQQDRRGILKSLWHRYHCYTYQVDMMSVVFARILDKNDQVDKVGHVLNLLDSIDPVGTADTALQM